MATKKKASKKKAKKATKKIVVPLDYEKPLDTVESKPSLLQSIINWFK